MIDLNNPATFKLSNAAHERSRNKSTGVSNSAAREDTSVSVLAAVYENRESYDSMTIEGKPILDVIREL
jgi:hypothetical protein